MKVLTEADLRAKRVSETGNREYHVPEGTFVTPTAKEYLREHKIQLLFDGQSHKAERTSGYGSMTRTPVFPQGKYTYVDGVTGEGYEEKPEDMTHLRGNILVSKTHPRIAFRGMLDSLQAHVLLIQAKNKDDIPFSQDLESVLSYIKAVLGAEVKGEALEETLLFGLNHKEIREKSHNVKKEFGIDHPIPDSKMGEKALEVNLLRTKVREAELCCAYAFPEGDEFNLIEHMNRLSSGIYILFCRILTGHYDDAGYEKKERRIDGMNREQIEKVILQVISRWQEEEQGRELPLDFPVEVSARHVHLTEEDIEKLFGPGAKLTPKRSLSQPGQFLSEERVTLVTAKGRIENVAVLGPARSHTQTELSLTDCRMLGLKAPLRMSGDLRGAEDVYIFGPKGTVYAKGSVIIAQAHIHMTPEEADKIGVANGQKVSVALPGERPVTMENVVCRVSQDAGLAMHIDFDEANGCMLKNNAAARMRVVGKTCISSGNQGIEEEKKQDFVDKSQGKAADYGEKLITEAIARKIVGEKIKSLTIKQGTILTPSAKDVFFHSGVELLWKGKGEKVC